MTAMVLDSDGDGLPDVDDTESLQLASESFTFTLTQDNGARCFGFSRRLAILAGGQPVCLCVLSSRPWFSLFMHLLDIVQLHFDLDDFIPAFMRAAHAAPLPPPGGTVKVTPELRGLPQRETFRLHVPTEDRPTGVAFEPLLAARNNDAE